MSAARNIFERAVEAKPTVALSPVTARPPEVRIASPGDEDQIFALWLLLAQESALAPINEHKVRALIRRAIGRDNMVIGIIEKNEEIIATVCLTVAQPWYSESWYCEEIDTFVHPDHRRGSANYAQKLIQFSKWWAEQMGMPLIMSILSTKRTLGKIRLYMRSLPLVGGVFMWRGTTGNG